MPAYSLLGDGQIPLNTKGGDREVKSTNTKQCHRMKLAVTLQPWRYKELWHVGLLPQEPHWLRASPSLGGRLVTDSGHTHRLSRHLGQWQTAAEREGQTQGCCDLHSKICHFRRLQTSFIKAIWLKPHGDTRQKSCTRERGSWKRVEVCWWQTPFNDNCLCKQFYY